MIFFNFCISSTFLGQNNEILQNTLKPTIGSKPSNTEINFIAIYEHTTYISITFKSRYNNEIINISSKSRIYDPLNPLFSHPIYGLENNILDKDYSLGPRGNLITLNLLFTKLPPGIQKINIEIPGAHSIIWTDVIIINPDNHPHTNWSTELLKTFWKENGIIEHEGIYESVNQNIASNLKIGILRVKDEFQLIFLEGFNAGIWKTGDIKGYMTETAVPNVYKTRLYTDNKEYDEHFYGTFNAGFLTITLKDKIRNIEYKFIKLFPALNSDEYLQKQLVSGTCFAISKNGLFVTNYHVIVSASLKFV